MQLNIGIGALVTWHLPGTWKHCIPSRVWCLSVWGPFLRLSTITGVTLSQELNLFPFPVAWSHRKLFQVCPIFKLQVICGSPIGLRVRNITGICIESSTFQHLPGGEKAPVIGYLLPIGSLSMWQDHTCSHWLPYPLPPNQPLTASCVTNRALPSVTEVSWECVSASFIFSNPWDYFWSVAGW